MWFANLLVTNNNTHSLMKYILPNKVPRKMVNSHFRNALNLNFFFVGEVLSLLFMPLTNTCKNGSQAKNNICKTYSRPTWGGGHDRERTGEEEGGDVKEKQQCDQPGCLPLPYGLCLICATLTEGGH